MAEQRDTGQEQTLNLLRNLGFARSDEQVDAYREKLAANAERHDDAYWERLRARLGTAARPAA